MRFSSRRLWNIQTIEHLEKWEITKELQVYKITSFVCWNATSVDILARALFFWIAFLHTVSTCSSNFSLVSVFMSDSFSHKFFYSIPALPWKQTLWGYKKQETENQSVPCLNTELKTICKMDEINRKTFLGGELFIKAISKLFVTSTEKYPSTVDRCICPTFLQTSRCVK